MLKKVFSLILLIIITLSVTCAGVVCQAEDINLVQDVDLLFNGHMEWLYTSYSCWTGSHIPETENVHGGKNALKLTTTEALTEAEKPNERRLYQQRISGLVPGETYTIGGWFYTENLVNGNFWKTAYAGMKIEIHSVTGGTAAYAMIELLPGTMLPYGQWTYGEASVKCPEGVPGTAQIHVRHDGIGTVLYDDLHVTGPTTVEKAAEISDKKESYQEGYDLAMEFATEQKNYTSNATLADDAVNFVKNNGFETANKYYNDTDVEFFEDDGDTSSGASSWTRSDYGREKNSTPEIVSLTKATAHSGTYSMKVHVPEDYSVYYSDPFVMQTLRPTGGETFVEGGEYILSSWIKTESDVTYKSGVYYKIQANHPDGTYLAFDNETAKVYDTNGGWQELKHVFTMPANISSIHIYIRLSGSGKGTFYCDDVTFGRSSNNDPLDFYSQHTFYYTEDDNIDATANIKTHLFTIENGSAVTFAITDANGTTVATQTVDAQAENSVTFPTSTLENKQTAYTLSATYKDASGNVLSSHSKRIYRYDRPTAINEKMNYVDPGTGEEIYPLFMYGAEFTTTEALSKSGFAVISIQMDENDDADIKAKLDDVYAKGMKVLMSLYDVTVSGHPSQINRTKHIISTFKDHPAIAAWMLWDEPSVHVRDGGILTYDEMLYYLEEAYKAVRNIDPVHPVYNIETINAFADSYERTGQMCDIFAIDPYSYTEKEAVGGYITQATQRAINAVYDERPVWVLGAASNFVGSYGKPTINSRMLRFQVYDALWAGAKGAGHYLQPTSDKDYAAANPDTYKTINSEIYNETFTKANEAGEIKELFEHFSLGRHTVFNEGTGNGYRYRSWYKDNGDMYLAVTSQLASNNAVLNSLITDIKLVNSDSTISLDGFDATLVNGISEEKITSSDNTFAMTLAFGEASLYKITPAENINFSAAGQKTPVAYGDELIENGDCETDIPTGFTGAVKSGEQAYEGDYSALVSGTYQKSDISLDYNADYVLSFNMYGENFGSNNPSVRMTYKDADGNTVTSQSVTIYNSFINNGKWTTHNLLFTVPADSAVTGATLALTLPSGATAYLDNLSLRKVTAYNESEILKNPSFEFFIPNPYYTGSNGTQPAGDWNTGGNQYSTFYVPPISEVAPHSGNHCIGLAANETILREQSVPVEYGKTYEISFWFNAKNLTDASTYPQLFLQTSGTVGYGQAGGHETKRFNFKDAYTKKDNGWVKYTAEYTVPEHQEGYDITKANLQFIMMGSSANVVGYFDDVSFRIKPEKTGYTLRNLTYSNSDNNVTVEYDVTNHFTESGGTVFYIFYDADGRFVKMEKEDASFDTLHVTRSFDKVDFASMKIFVWDSLGGLIPYSNVIQ